MKKMNNLMNRISEDRDFAEAFAKDPRAAAASVGVQLDEAEINTLQDAIVEPKISMAGRAVFAFC